MEIEEVDQKILSLLKEGKTTRDIAGIISHAGYRTAKGDIYLRKTVNNRITLLRSKGVEIPPLTKDNRMPRSLKSKMILIKPNIYRAANGKYRVRKWDSADKKFMCSTFVQLKDAEDFEGKITARNNEGVIPQVVNKRAKPNPTIEEIYMPVFDNSNKRDDNNITMVICSVDQVPEVYKKIREANL